MLQHSDLVALWGPHRVVRFDRDALEDASIPGGAKTFLAEVGLPWRIWHAFTVEAGVDLEASHHSPGMIREIEEDSLGDGGSLRIGWDYGSDVWILESGEIWALSGDQSVPEGSQTDSSRFMNTSVEHFVESLAAFSKMRAAAVGPVKVNEDAMEAPNSSDQLVSDADAQALVDDLERQLRRIDAAAFQKPDCWWPEVLEGSLI